MTTNGKNGREAVILSSARTPQGRFLGGLAGLFSSGIGKDRGQSSSRTEWN